MTLDLDSQVEFGVVETQASSPNNRSTPTSLAGQKDSTPPPSEAGCWHDQSARLLPRERDPESLGGRRLEQGERSTKKGGT